MLHRIAFLARRIRYVGVQRTRTGLLAAALLLPFAAFAQNQVFLQAQGTRWARSDGAAIELRGTNLGTWLLPEFWMLGYPDDAPVNDQCKLEAVLDKRFGYAQRQRLLTVFRDNWMRERDWDLIGSFGLNLVRLPFLWSVIEDERRPGHLRPDAWRYLDAAIVQAKARGMYVVLDLHGTVGAQGKEHHSGCANQNLLWSRPDYQARTAWLWQQIAKRYKNEPVVAAYGLLNEPWGSSDTQLVEVVRRLYADIRKIDTRHIILLPDHPKGIGAYGNPAALGMRNVVFETHPYPGHFGWAQPGLEVHRNWLGCLPDGGGLCDWKKRMAAIQTPLFMGEFQPWADMDAKLGGQISRASFDAYAAQGWASAVWSYKMVRAQNKAASTVWGLVMNADDAPVPQLDFRKASLQEIESLFQLYGSMPYRVRTEVRDALQSSTATPL